MLTYDGGMMTTPAPMNDPSRTELPPGTIRTPPAPLNRFKPRVSLSRNVNPLSEGISAICPTRNASRIPFLTQVFTRQLPAETSAARALPRFNISLSSPTAWITFARWPFSICSGGSSNNRSMVSLSGISVQQFEIIQNLLKPRPVLHTQFDHRQPVHLLDKSHGGERRFHRNRIRFHKIEVHQWEELVMDLRRPFEFPFQAKADHFRKQFRDHIRDDRHDAVGAECGEGERDRVVARPDAKPLLAVPQNLHDLCEIARRLLDPCDARNFFAHPENGFRFDVARSPARDVVNDDFGVHRFRYGEIMPEIPFLCRLIIVGADRKNCVGARLYCLARERDRLGGRIRACARNNLRLLPRLLGYDPDDARLLVVRECRALSRRSGGENRLDAVRDLEVDKFPQGLLVDLPFRREGGDERRAGSAK